MHFQEPLSPPLAGFLAVVKRLLNPHRYHCPPSYLRLPVLGLVPLFLQPVAATAQSVSNSPSSPVTNSFKVRIKVDASHPGPALIPCWRFFGADEPNYASFPNGQKLLGELGALAPRTTFFRAHNLLTSGDGTPELKWGSTGAYDETSDSQPRYHWSLLDGIFDTYLQSGVRPYVEIGFMPEALSSKPEPYQHHWNPHDKYASIFTGWAYPPKDYKKWDDLVYEWARHCMTRYGREEVESWYWEVWNEPNIGYWQGTPEEFMKLHDFAIDGVKRALPSARVGGPDAAGSGGNFTRHFLEHCLRGTNYATGNIGTPIDFVSFHAKGAPSYIDGHVRMGISAQVRAIDDGFRIVSSFPELKAKPIIIGESDPEGCAACQGPSLAYRNGTMYSSYTAAVFARKFELAARRGVNLEGALTWAFEFENQPFFAGFRALATGGVDKPVLNVFRMFSRMSGQQITTESDHAVPLDAMLKEGVRNAPDVSARASLEGRKLCVLAWHYHDDDVPGPQAEVELTLQGLPREARKVRLEHFRIDETHSNSFSAWKRLGSPSQPTPEQLAALELAGQLERLDPSSESEVSSGRLTLRFSLPRQAVSLLELTW